MLHASSAAHVTRRLAASFCVICAVVVATVANGGAASHALGQAPAARSTPQSGASPTPKSKPTATPCPSDSFSPAGKPDLGVALLGGGEGAATCGTTGSQLPLAPDTVTPSPVAIAMTDKGLTVRYRFESSEPYATFRKVGGVPMIEPGTGHPAGEDRFEVTVGDPQRSDHFVTVAVNANGACFLTGRNISDPDQHRACTASPSPTPSPAPGAAAKSCPAEGCFLAGTVTVPLSFLGGALNTKPGPNPNPSSPGSTATETPASDASVDPKSGVQRFYFCFAHRTTAIPTFRDTAKYVAAMNATAPAQTKPRPCATYAVRIIDGSKGVYRVAGDVSDGNQPSAGDSSAGGTSAAGLRRDLARSPLTQSNGSSTTPGSGRGASVGALLTFVHPFSYSMRGSFQVQNNGLVSSVDKQTQRYFADFSAAQAQLTPSGASLTATPNTSDEFTKLDTDILQRVLPRPYRGYEETGAAPKAELKAFDATHLLDLAPFDPNRIKEVTYGGKLTWFPTDAAFGLGYFRDRMAAQNGTILHGDGTLGRFTFGLSEVVANSQSASSNKYVTALHTANTVMGIAADFDGGWKAYGRLGTIGTGQDRLAAISFADQGSGRIIDDSGTTVRNALLLGYRAIDAGYAPLAMQFNNFAGNQMVFARLGTTTTRWAPGAVVHPYETTLNLSRAANGGIPAYSNVGLTQTIPLYGGFSLDLVAARSTIAGSVVARQDGKFLVTGPAATALLDNDTATANLSFESKTAQLKLGESLTHSPSCTSATSCTSSFAHALTGSASVVSGFWLVNGNIQPGSTQNNNPGGASLASNQIVRSYLAAYHVCHIFGSPVGMEPSVVYKNNISEDSSSFTPGNLVEEDVDIGTLKGIALRLSYKRAADQHWLPVPLTSQAFSFTFVSPTQTIWQTNNKIDPCIAREKDGNQPKQSLKTPGDAGTPTVNPVKR